MTYHYHGCFINFSWSIAYVQKSTYIMVQLSELSQSEHGCVTSTQIKKHHYQTRASSLHYLLRVKCNLLKVSPLPTSNSTYWSNMIFISIYRIFTSRDNVLDFLLPDLRVSGTHYLSSMIQTTSHHHWSRIGTISLY